jgi:hypothetical protein
METLTLDPMSDRSEGVPASLLPREPPSLPSSAQYVPAERRVFVAYLQVLIM